MKRIPLSHERVFSSESLAESYTKNHQKMAENFGHGYARRLAAAGFRRGKILDAGCGFGAAALVLAQTFQDSQVVGVDLSGPLLEVARSSAKAANINGRLRFEKGDVHRLPFEDRSFDVVLNFNMVHRVDDPVRMLDEIERVLAPGGVAYIADVRRSWLGLLENEIRSGISLPEAKQLFGRSTLRGGVFSWGLVWWRWVSRP